MWEFLQGTSDQTKDKVKPRVSRCRRKSLKLMNEFERVRSKANPGPGGWT